MITTDYLPAWQDRGLGFDDTVLYAGTPLAGDEHALIGVPATELVRGLVTEEGTRVFGVQPLPRRRLRVFEGVPAARPGCLLCRWRSRHGILRYTLRADDVVAIRVASARRTPPRGWRP